MLVHEAQQAGLRFVAGFWQGGTDALVFFAAVPACCFAVRAQQSACLPQRRNCSCCGINCPRVHLQARKAPGAVDAVGVGGCGLAAGVFSTAPTAAAMHELPPPKTAARLAPRLTCKRCALICPPPLQADGSHPRAAGGAGGGGGGVRRALHHLSARHERACGLGALLLPAWIAAAVAACNRRCGGCACCGCFPTPACLPACRLSALQNAAKLARRLVSNYGLSPLGITTHAPPSLPDTQMQRRTFEATGAGAGGWGLGRGEEGAGLNWACGGWACGTACTRGWRRCPVRSLASASHDSSPPPSPLLIPFSFLPPQSRTWTRT